MPIPIPGPYLYVLGLAGNVSSECEGLPHRAIIHALLYEALSRRKIYTLRSALLIQISDFDHLVCILILVLT